MDHLYKISKNIEEEYNLDLNNLEEKIFQTVSIDHENDSNNEDIILKKNDTGYLWMIKILNTNNECLLIPGYKVKSKLNFRFTSHYSNDFRSLFNSDNFEEFEKGKTRFFTIDQPAIVNFIGNDQWKLKEKGTLIFGKPLISSSVTSECKVNRKISDNTKEDNIERQKKDNNFNQEKEISTLPKSIDELIKSKIREYLDMEFAIKLTNVKESIRDEISDKITKNIDNELSQINKSITEIKDKYSSLSKIIKNPEKSDFINQEDSNKKTIIYDSEVENNQSSSLDNNQKHHELNLIYKELNEIKSNNKLIRKLENDLASLKQTTEENIIGQLKSLEKSIKKLEQDEENIQKNHINFSHDDTFLEFKTKLKLINKLKIDFTILRKEVAENKKILESINKQPEDNNKISLSFFIDFPQSDRDIEFLEQYNNNPRSLSNNATKVAATRESIEQIRSGIKTPLILKKDENDSYWILNEPIPKDGYFYLVPKANLIINDRIYQTVEDIFTCQGYEYRTSNNFKLSCPAVVKLSDSYEDEWELVQPGELEFT